MDKIKMDNITKGTIPSRFRFRNILPDETDQAATIEKICFPPNEACSETMMRKRVAKAPELFLVAEDRETGKLAGFLNGLSTDEDTFRDEFFTDAELYNPVGKNIMILGLDVLPEYRGQGLAKAIVAEYIRRERERGREMLLLTCLESKVRMYEKMGFVNKGIATSSWGGEQWYEMSYTLTEYFPDHTPIDSWFYDTRVPKLADMGKQYVLTDYGIFDDGRIYTAEIQSLIDRVQEEGGGVIVVPPGTYLTGSLFFKQGVHLYVSEGGVLKGSSDISDYEIRQTRIEGETCKYFTALINADGVDGFTIFGPGTIDGNGLKSWKAFWLRRAWNPNCTNKDEQRPRLVYLSNCTNVLLADVHLINAHFWTTHLYKCQHVKYLNCYIYSPATPVKAPSTDAIDIDVCTDVLVKNCYMEVNDDAVVLKGGKGPWADTAPENGSNERILVEDCTYGFCHGCLTCGSESVHNRNILIRRIKVHSGYNLLWLKMRPDTPQHYEYITVEEVEGRITNFINVNPWTQFFDLKGREDMPVSLADHVVVKNCNCECNYYFNVKKNEEQYRLSDFTFENLDIRTKKDGFVQDAIENVRVENVEVKEI